MRNLPFGTNGVNGRIRVCGGKRSISGYVSGATVLNGLIGNGKEASP